MKEERFYTNHNHNNKQAARPSRQEAPPSRVSCEQAMPGGGRLMGVTSEGRDFGFVGFEFSVKGRDRETTELGDGL